MTYEQELEYQLELIRKAGPTGIPKMAALTLDELVRGLASGKLPNDETERKKGLFYSLAAEMKDSPEMLERFRGERFLRTAKAEYEDKPDPDFNRRSWELTLSIVRAECAFIEPFLTVLLSEVKALLDHWGKRLNATA